MKRRNGLYGRLLVNLPASRLSAETVELSAEDCSVSGAIAAWSVARFSFIFRTWLVSAWMRSSWSSSACWQLSFDLGWEHAAGGACQRAAVQQWWLKQRSAESEAAGESGGWGRPTWIERPASMFSLSCFSSHSSSLR